jgi:myo-inositol-1(or 4)-monophosphatase
VTDLPDAAGLFALIAPAAAQALSFAQQREDLPIDHKGAGQFVTEADRAVETAIRAQLAARFGPVAVLGEEEGGALDGAETGWVIDPIDGTSNFLRGLPLWGVSIGYVARGAPVAGVVALPALGETLCTAGDGLLWRNGALLAPRSGRSPVRLIALGENDWEPGPVTDARAQAFRASRFAVARYNCAVFAQTSAALGWTDGYVERGCGLWDIAAGAAICRAAGLAVAVENLGEGRWAIDARRT